LDQRKSSLQPSKQSEVPPVSPDDWHQVALAWQHVAFANFQLCCQLSTSKLLFQTDLSFEFDALKRLVLFWLDLQEVSFDQKKALVQLFAQILSLDELRPYLEPS
jgi:hypothetical protein